MIWIDSSFAVEWLLGTERARALSTLQLGGSSILDNQYSEVITFFLKRNVIEGNTAAQLDGLFLERPEKEDLHRAAALYLTARRKGSKASLADAILAAVIMRTKEELLSFDLDFEVLGLKVDQKRAIWSA